MTLNLVKYPLNISLSSPEFSSNIIYSYSSLEAWRGLLRTFARVRKYQAWCRQRVSKSVRKGNLKISSRLRPAFHYFQVCHCSIFSFRSWYWNFSADDHDYCEYLHSTTEMDKPEIQFFIPEVTVKSFSMATKLKRPGFQLLSLVTSQNDTLASPSYFHSQCLLPDQSSIYTRGYSFLFLFTTVLFIILNSRRSKPPRLDGHLAWDGHQRFQTLDSASPGRRSPPASPIQFKSSSRSRMTALRGASTLPVTTSEPATPLGGSPFLSPSFPQHIDDEDSQELLTWQSQLDAPKQSPYIYEQNREMDSSYFLPSPGFHPKLTNSKNVWRQSVITRATCRPWSFSKLTMTALTIVQSMWSTGPRRARTRYGRCLQDLSQAFLLPFFVYLTISFWLYLWCFGRPFLLNPYSCISDSMCMFWNKMEGELCFVLSRAYLLIVVKLLIPVACLQPPANNSSW